VSWPPVILLKKQPWRRELEKLNVLQTASVLRSKENTVRHKEISIGRYIGVLNTDPGQKFDSDTIPIRDRWYVTLQGYVIFLIQINDHLGYTTMCLQQISKNWESLTAKMRIDRSDLCCY
jgi:hypothetical protein